MFRAEATAPLVRIVAHDGQMIEDWGSIYIEGAVHVGQVYSVNDWRRLGLVGRAIDLPDDVEELFVRDLVRLPQPDTPGKLKRLRPKVGPEMELHVEVRRRS